MGRILAAADIGSNTVHLLIAETDGNGKTLTRLDNRSEWVSLGETVARLGEIPIDVASKLIDNLQTFKRLAKAGGAESLYVFGTEAMRAAPNHADLIKIIRLATGLTVDLISPHREVELSLRGALLDSPKGVDFLVEAGGGSVQIATVSRTNLVESASVPIGTGRLIAEMGLKNPCAAGQVEATRTLIRKRLDTLGFAPGFKSMTAVASGGVVRGLWRALHPDGENCLHRQEMAYMAWATAYLPVTRIAGRFNVKNKRAATLLPGALVYGELMDRFQITDLHVSEYGVREGAILEIAKGSVQGCLV